LEKSLSSQLLSVKARRKFYGKSADIKLPFPFEIRGHSRSEVKRSFGRASTDLTMSAVALALAQTGRAKQLRRQLTPLQKMVVILCVVLFT